MLVENKNHCVIGLSAPFSISKNSAHICDESHPYTVGYSDARKHSTGAISRR